MSSLLLIFLGMSLASCDGLTFGQNCVGQNISCISPTPTPNAPALVATANAITQSKPLLSDPLKQADANGWSSQSGDGFSCSFHDGAYYVTNNHNPAVTLYCDTRKLQYSDVAIQIDVTLISGYDAGIVFRVDPTTSSEMYFCGITDQGEADLRLFGTNGVTTTLIPETSNSAIHGKGKKNTLLVIAKGDDFQIFVNRAFIGEVHDGTLAGGFLGMAATNYTENAKASFSNVRIYQV